MIIFFRAAIICLFIFATNIAYTTPHLILYFDINETIIAYDTVTKKTQENILSQIFARRIFDNWSSSQVTPISFEYYVNTILFPEEDPNAPISIEGYIAGTNLPEPSPETKIKRSQQIYRFLEYLAETKHPSYKMINEKFSQALAALKESPGSIFPSFYRAIEELNKRNLSYTIILRTFGNDGPTVKKTIEEQNVLQITKSAKFRNGELHLEDGTAIRDHDSIYAYFRSIDHWNVHDHFDSWKANEFSGRHGKVFYVDREDKDVHSIFFDDNLHIHNGEKNIITPLDPKSGEMLSVVSLAESKQLIRVNTLEAILNPNYFIDLIDSSLDIAKKKAEPVIETNQ